MNHPKRWPLRPWWGRGVLFLSVTLAFAMLASVAGAVPTERGALLRDGVVIAPERGLAYVMRPSGGIDAGAFAAFES